MRLATLIAALVTAGCGTGYVYGRVGDLSPPPRQPHCTFTLLDAVPARPFDELGIIAPADIIYGDVTSSPPFFTDAVSPWVCASGGDAVVVERDMFGHYIRGTVIKYR
jgi:hypothetical protein